MSSHRVMINLFKNSGLSVRLDLNSLKLTCADDVLKIEPDIRTIQEMKGVLLDKKIDAPRELYYMYRGLCKLKDKEKITANRLRYDITIIRGGFLGDEFIKTSGHYHNQHYPEIYEVLWGEALCLMQKPQKDDFSKIEDIVLVKAKAKEKIMVLPDYGHILVNPSADFPLVVANWISSDCRPDYSQYKQSRGAAYFITNNEGEFRFVNNEFFKQLPKVRIVRPRLDMKDLGLLFDIPLYDTIEQSNKLSFLNDPHRYNYDSCFMADKAELKAAIPL